MTPATAFRGKRVALFGLGGSGLSTARALVAGGADVVAWDDSEKSVAKAQAAGIPIGDLRDFDFAFFSSLVLSPGVPLTHPTPHWTVEKAQAADVEIIGDVEVFSRERALIAPAAPFIAITGTNGKSTTTALIGHIIRQAGLDAQVGGNIGIPVMDLLSPSRGRVHVVECSSYQIDLAPSLKPSVGILLNLSEDHLERHGTMDNYAAIKERLAAQADVPVVGTDDDLSAAIADRISSTGKKVERISQDIALSFGVYGQGARLVRGQTGNEIADLAGIGSLRGLHNMQNAAAAAAACLAIGLDAAMIERGLRTFPGLAHRLEQVGHLGKVLFVNDSKATNADSAAQALGSFPSDIYWIAGGRPKSGGITALAPFFPRIAKAYLIGEAAAEFSETLGATPYEIAGTMEKAVESASRDALLSSAAEPVVLLSPACASFDQYPNFEVRGDDFRRLALERIEGGKTELLP